MQSNSLLRVFNFPWTSEGWEEETEDILYSYVSGEMVCRVCLWYQCGVSLLLSAAFLDYCL